jgi:hypothetical protein
MNRNINSNSATISYLDSATYFIISTIFVEILMITLCLMAEGICHRCRKLKKSGYETDDGYEEDIEDKELNETGRPKND